MQKKVWLVLSLLLLVFTLACGLFSPIRMAIHGLASSTPAPEQNANLGIQITAYPADISKPESTPTMILPTAGPTVVGGYAGYYLTIIDQTADTPARLSLFDYRSNEIKALWTFPAVQDKLFYGLFPSPQNDLLLITECIDLGYCDLYTWGLKDQAAKKITQRQIKVNTHRLQWFPDGTAIFLPQPGNSVSKSSVDIIRLSDGNIEEREFQFNFDAWLSPDGTKILYMSQGDLSVMDIDGKNQETILSNKDVGQFSWFPDGKRIWFNLYEGNKAGATIYVLNLETGEQTKLTGKKGGYFYGVVISPDEKYLLFRLSTPGISNDPATNNLLWIVPSDGSREAVKIGFSSQDDFGDFASNYRFSPDGTMILFNGFPPDRRNGQPGDYSVRLDGSNITPLDPSFSGFLLKKVFWINTPLQ